MTDQTITRIEGRLKVTGQAVYAAETPAEGLLHAVLIEAPIASGKVIDLDASAARKVAGFADIISYAEAESLKPSSVTALIREPAIHFRGQPVKKTYATEEFLVPLQPHVERHAGRADIGGIDEDFRHRQHPPLGVVVADACIADDQRKARIPTAILRGRWDKLHQNCSAKSKIWVFEK